jgi:hypothetical protein
MKDLLYKLTLQRLLNPEYPLLKTDYQLLHVEILNESRSKALVKKIITQIQEIVEMVYTETDPITFMNNINLFGDEPDSDVKANPEKSDCLTDNQHVDFTGYRYEIHPVKNTDLKSIGVMNAGLILAHPFFWDFLIRTNCTDGKSRLLPEKRQYAVQLLHYLATGQENQMEYKLTFEKFICSIPLDSPVNRKIVLSNQDKIECSDLLRSITGYWGELKKTSPDGIRDMFMKRPGKLDLHTVPYKLFVEQKAQDVLIEKLEWNISIVKLPFTDEMLFVEW